MSTGLVKAETDLRLSLTRSTRVNLGGTSTVRKGIALFPRPLNHAIQALMVSALRAINPKRLTGPFGFVRYLS